MNWNEISIEYRREIIAIHNDILRAISILETRNPRSFLHGLSILEKALDMSEENVRMIKMLEPIESTEKSVEYSSKLQKLKVTSEDQFSDLFLSVKD